MCGIVGSIGGNLGADPRATIENMADAMLHRGPDDRGSWLDAEQGVAFGFRRLAIVDLSPHGRQPMLSPDGRRVIVFNGEIYNHRQLRAEIERDAPELLHGVQGHSDTAVLLAAIARWGVKDALQRLVGMFAFAVWDRHERTLTLARDRLGEKPLYYGWLAGGFVFASELKPLRRHPNWRADIDPDAVALLLRHNYIPAPRSIYRGLAKLLPGSYLQLAGEQLPHGTLDACRPTYYWDPHAVVQTALAHPFTGSEAEAETELERRLNEALSLQKIADVPVGAFLSGGIDSSTVVALLAKQNSNPVRTFTVGFWEPKFNEAEQAKAIALHLKTEHYQLYVTPQMALDVIPRLPQVYDEPFADSSQIPTFLVAQMARRHVSVSISGDGADEILAGYTRYPRMMSLWNSLQRVPAWCRPWLGRLLRAAPSSVLERLSLSARMRGQFSSGILERMASCLQSPQIESVYRSQVSHWQHPEAIVPGSRDPLSEFTNPARRLATDELLNKLIYLDLVTYLPDDILVKVDRAAMGVSLESRTPYLDHRVVEFAWSLPLAMKFDGQRGKQILRRILYRYVPESLIERPKKGFGVPIGAWLRGPLRDWAEALLDPAKLQMHFNPGPIRRRWQQHLAGQVNWDHSLWNVLMFQAWLEAT